MPLATSSLGFTLGLLATFGGIGLVVNGLIVYILIVVYGEHEENYESLSLNDS